MPTRDLAFLDRRTTTDAPTGRPSRGLLSQRLLGTALLAAVAAVPATPANAQLGITGSQIFHQADGVIPGPADDFEQFGRELATGDFDGDGFDDLAVAAPFEHVVPFDGAGTVTVIYGTVDGLDGTLAEAWSFESGTAPPANTGDEFGTALAAGDFDGDGFDDLAIGIPGHDVVDASEVLHLGAGAVLVMFGSADGLTAAASQLRTLESSAVPGAAAGGDGFGAELAVGNFDGDLYDDLAIGAPGKAVGGDADAGVVTVFYGSSSGFIVTVFQGWSQDTTGLSSSAATNERFGAILAAGDLDGDGFDDLAVGSPGQLWSGSSSAGSVTLIYGGASGLVSTGSAVLAQELTAANASETSDEFGDALAIGDANGDGIDDLAVGTPYEDVDVDADSEIVDAGIVEIYLGVAEVGPSGAATAHLELLELDSHAEMSERFGYALAFAELDGSPGSELAVGTPGYGAGDVVASGGAAILSGSDGTFDDLVWTSQDGAVPGILETGDQLGQALAAGDFDGNGFDDLAIGVPLESAGGHDFAGAVNVLYSVGIFRDGFERIGFVRWSQTQN